jgi:hypothetical protein
MSFVQMSFVQMSFVQMSFVHVVLKAWCSTGVVDFSVNTIILPVVTWQILTLHHHQVNPLLTFFASIKIPLPLWPLPK